MNKSAIQIEGTWEEISARGQEFSGRKVRLILLDREVGEPTKSMNSDGGPDADVTDPLLAEVDAWMASLPHFDGTDEEFAAFDKAIADNRAERRTLAREQRD